MVPVECCLATCVHDKPFLLASFCGQLHFFRPSAGAALLVSLDYDWLCASIKLPQQNATTWFNMGHHNKASAGVVCISLFWISWWQRCQWQHCEIVIMLLPENGYLTYCETYCYSTLVIILHLFWLCSGGNAVRSILIVYLTGAEQKMQIILRQQTKVMNIYHLSALQRL